MKRAPTILPEPPIAAGHSLLPQRLEQFAHKLPDLCHQFLARLGLVVGDSADDGGADDRAVRRSVGLSPRSSYGLDLVTRMVLSVFGSRALSRSSVDVMVQIVREVGRKSIPFFFGDLRCNGRKDFFYWRGIRVVRRLLLV
jgi:hypothetical protein